MIDIAKQNEKLLFEENIGQVLFEIIKKYKLEESTDEVFKKIETDQPFPEEIIINIIEDLFFGKIQEKNIPILLQQKLNISQDVSENIFSDIKIKIMPLIKKSPESDDTEPTAKEKSQTIESNRPDLTKKIIEPNKVAEKVSEKIIRNPTSSINPAENERNRKKIGRTETSKEIKSIKQKNIQDNYREPIE